MTARSKSIGASPPGVARVRARSAAPQGLGQRGPAPRSGGARGSMRTTFRRGRQEGSQVPQQFRAKGRVVSAGAVQRCNS